MSSVIISEKDLKRLGQELLKEVYEFLHDDYIISTFEEMLKEKEKFLRNLIFKNSFDKFSVDSSLNESEDNIDKLISKKSKDDTGKLISKVSTFKDKLKILKYKIDKGLFDCDEIYYALDNLYLDFEIDEDLYKKVKAYIKIYEIFKDDYIYL